MKRSIKSILPLTLAVFAILLVSGITASAQRRCPPRGNINQRQNHQQDRIGQGVESGQLTAREAARIEGQEARINAEEARMRASGEGLSPRERARLESQLNRESRNIYRQKHDGQN